MKRFWQYSIAMVLGLASLSPAWAQQNNPVAPFRIPNAQLQQNQLQANQRNPIPQAQGVNRNPGQAPLADQQAQQNQQFLGTNQQGQQFNNQRNAVDEFGARVDVANQAIANQLGINPPNPNPHQNPGIGGMLDSGPSQRARDTMWMSNGFAPANLSSWGATSSIEEGILTGQGRFLQGAGEYNRNSAEALKAIEQARALYLDNRRTGLKTYFELKQLNAEYRAATAPMPVSKAKLDQWNEEDQPERLTRREYNSDTGRVQWPSVLLTPAFDAHRQQLDSLFARRTASEFGVNSDFYRLVNQEATAMRELLKGYLKSEDKFFNDQEYIAAKNFLDSLANEARLAPDLEGLAFSE